MAKHFGKAFLDQFQKSSSKSGRFHKIKNLGNEWQDNLISGQHQGQTGLVSPWRKVLIMVIFISVFAIFSARLFHLQVVEGKNNRELADNNRIQVRTIHAPRGVIYDRNGNIVARNDPGFRLVLKQDDQTTVKFITREQALKMEVDDDPLYQSLEIDSVRHYPAGRVLSHLLGYVGEVTKEELENPEFQNYRVGDKIGRGGIEQVYEKILRGVDGGEIYEVDAQGRKGRTIRKIEAIPGQNIYLSLDLGLQKKAYQKLEEGIKNSGSCCGALIIQDPTDGQVLSLVSYPAFDPHDITNSLNQANSPFLNRVIAGVYPPGSTFKISTSMAGLMSGKITKQTIFEDTGVVNLGPFKFHNWYFTQYGKTEGQVDLVKALKRSNDTYYYRLGELVGEKMIGETAKKMGLGKKLGIDLPGEETGIIPDNQWKVNNFGQVWYPGDTLHMSIGQGFVLTTPLQINYLVSIVASDGKQFPPHLVQKITDEHGNLIKEYNFDSTVSNAFKAEDINVIKEGLEQVTKAGGTAWPFFNFPIQTAGKTGTAEFGHPQDKTHAWYTAYAPVDRPRLSFTVVVEGGGEGSSVGGPIAKEVFRWYFSEDKNNLIKDIVPVVSTESARILGE